MNPLVAIVVVSWNTRDILNDCLRSIYQETSADLIEVIVVDNNSSDDSCEMVRQHYPDVMLIENDQNVGFAAANNQGFAAARGKYVLMLNSDTVILENALKKVLDYAENHPKVAVLGCKQFFADMSFQSSCFRFPGILSVLLNAVYLPQLFKNSSLINRDRYGNREWFEERDVDCVMGSFLWIRRELLLEAGCLDTDYFMFGEEVDLCYKIKKNGGLIRYYPHARIIHIWAGSQKGATLSAWAYQAEIRGRLMFMAKNKSLFEAYLCTLLMLLFMIPRVLMWTVLDAIDKVRPGQSRDRRRLSRAAIVLFFLKVLVNPKLLYSKWASC